MSAKVTVEQFWKGKEVKIQGQKVVGRSTFETGLVVERQAKALCPVKTGLLAGSITTQAVHEGTEPTMGSQKIQPPLNEEEVLVGTPVEYGWDVEFGTGPHKITVKTAKVLTDGKTFFGKTVNHPGTMAQPFLRPALALARGETLTILEKEGRYYFKEYLS